MLAGALVSITVNPLVFSVTERACGVDTGQSPTEGAL